MAETLRFIYFGCLLYCLLFFAFWSIQLIRRRRPDHSVPKRSSFPGILSAFTRGMAPWRKESASRNPLGYGAGVIYHLVSFSSFVVLAFPALLLQRSTTIISILSAGFACGLYLLFKRVFNRHLRFMSEPGDYVANVLVDLMQLSVILTIFGVTAPFVCYAAACVVLLYLPFGKLKHCYYFFASRLLLGRSYGRKGVMV
ncbi:hypothetical protein E3J62_02270 [candidate division TA06 bacterium]|uniref:NarG-like domain-containing protein n=1 Tax=candidate division TA06 bacterium TaxID=2250710 RepID=A0A523UXC1_UNCT6|nr:MAG: hypothetical protein E3J62_02270 [candidate division TA06 bacterium]